MPRKLEPAGVSGANYDNTEWQSFDGLLKFKTAIKRDEDVAYVMGPAQQLAVLDAGLAQAVDCENLMTCQKSCKVDRKIFVKQQPHQPPPSQKLRPGQQPSARD